MKTRVLVLAVLGGAAGLSGSVLGQTWTFIPNLLATDASADAGVIIGDTLGQSSRWTRSGGVEVFGGEPGFGTSNTAEAVSRDGTMIFGTSRRSSGRYQMYRWTGPGTFQGLGNAQNATNLEVQGANVDGTVVVGTVSAAQGAVYEGFIWTPQGGIQPIPGLGGFSQANGVSADGTKVIGLRRTPSNTTEAYIWSANAGITALRAVNGGSSQAYDMSADGRFVVGLSADDNGRATLWTHGTPRSLGVLENFVDSRAISVSDDGSIVTGYCMVLSGPADPNRNRFVWTEAWGMLESHEFLGRHGFEIPLGMRLDEVKVSRDGRTIYGWGVFNSQNYGTFVATIPSPGSLMIFVGFSLVPRRRR